MSKIARGRPWYALDVGCAMLQLRFEHEDGLTVQNLASLVDGEPDPALFQLPADFQEVTPSGLYEPICSPSGKCTSPSQSYLQRLDDDYRALRAKALVGSTSAGTPVP